MGCKFMQKLARRQGRKARVDGYALAYARDSANEEAGEDREETRPPLVFRERLAGRRLDDDECDEQSEEHERLDKCERDDHKRLNRSGRAGVTSSTFGSTRSDKTLSDTSETGSKTESDTGSDRFCSVDRELVVTSSSTCLGHRRQSRNDDSKRRKK